MSLNPSQTASLARQTRVRMLLFRASCPGFLSGSLSEETPLLLFILLCMLSPPGLQLCHLATWLPSHLCSFLAARS
ncbi:uncharacterized protein BDZ99DRAFT_312032 [Mytilinidion resinicola]|uniref:Uncharacterized protein n=1 Tax=Mytilinidion resinicola TaxID=574789 RepID=A0A6A6YPD7_9PEZI|nr:uncharacterized protein BDZ99DRAFT_312032 [Mytilinidion resinicola]KAF2810443.1 hypothetical protein BDZ99DRAFT_312032 [Mytilinidion resinicola]